MKKCKYCRAKYSVMMKIQTEKYVNGKLKKKKIRWLCPRCFLPISRYLGMMDNENEYEKKYEKIVEIVKECDATLNIDGMQQFQKVGTIIGTYFDIKEVIEA